MVDPARLPNLPAIIAPERLGTYLRACRGDPQRAVRLYTWNVEIAAAMWGPLHVLEVALRNAIHHRLAEYAGRRDWWRRLLLHHPQPEQVAAAIRAAAANHPAVALTDGHVVAELSLGFWTALLANRYHARLWEPALSGVFRHRPSGTRRGDIQALLDPLRRLRNRIAHHEPVFARSLADDHAAIVTVLGYLSADARIWVASHSRVPPVLARRAGCEAGALWTSF